MLTSQTQPRTIIRLGASHSDVTVSGVKSANHSETVDLRYASRDQLSTLGRVLCEIHGIKARSSKKRTPQKAH